MKVLNREQIQAVDAYTIEHEPVASTALMERAARACVRRLTGLFDRNRKILIFIGPGNNGGDGLAGARMLHELSYDVSVYMLTKADKLSPDAFVNFRRLSEIKPIVLTGKNMPHILPSTVVIDAMFGSGLSRPLEGLAAQTVAHINASGAAVVAIDIPSGLFCESNENNNSNAVIRARHTLTFQQPKLSFFFAENAPHVGELTVLDIGLSPEGIDQQPSKIFTLEKNDIAGMIPPRDKFAHKGNFGHACIIAGSRGMAGAAVLATKACLRTGAGLVTAHIPGSCNDIMQISVPEALVSPDQHPDILTRIPDLSAFSAIGIGPGIGRVPETQQALSALLHTVNAGKTDIPNNLVLDADALNILSENPDRMQLLPPNCIITPHPREFDRLAGKSENGYQRWCKQMEMARKYGIIVVLKGAYTSVATSDGYCFFNTTGNPGMATGGSGDVLTGIIVSLSAQGWSPVRAACAGVWIHGAAGDRAGRKSGAQALIARDIIKNIGKVFKNLQVPGG